jgi:hypothetical protein
MKKELLPYLKESLVYFEQNPDRLDTSVFDEPDNSGCIVGRAFRLMLQDKGILPADLRVTIMSLLRFYGVKVRGLKDPEVKNFFLRAGVWHIYSEEKVELAIKLTQKYLEKNHVV